MPTTITIRDRSDDARPSLVRRALEAIRSYTVAPMSLKDPALARLFGAGYETAAGIPVTDQNVFTFSAVYDAVNQSSSDLAKLPLNLRIRMKEGGSRPFDTSKTYWLLKHEANPDMSAFEFKRTLQAHALTCKGAFAEIERDGLDRPTALWPLTPDRVVPFVEPEKLLNGRYRSKLRYRIDGDDQHVIEAADMIHIKGLGYDGYCAYPVIDRARQAIGIALAAERYAGAFFGNNSNLGGLLTSENPDLDETQAKEIQERIEKLHKGPDRAWRLLVLGAGFKYARTGVTPSESQLDQVRDGQVVEVARFFNMPVHKLKNLTRSTNNNIEQQDLEYYKGHQLNWITNWESELNRKLVPSLEVAQQFFKHNATAALRGDVAARTELYSALLDRGVICADDVLELEDMNPQPNGQGKIYLVQGAMVPKDKVQAIADANIEKAKRKPAPPAAPAPDPGPAPSRSTRIILDEHWRDVLSLLPESGMGYQRVDVLFTDGRKIVGAHVFNGRELEVPDSHADGIVSTLTLTAGVLTDSDRAARAEVLAEEARQLAQQEREARVAAEAAGVVTAAELERLRTAEQTSIARAAQLELVAEDLRREQQIALEARQRLEAELLEAQQARDAATTSANEATARAESASAAQVEAEQRAVVATTAAADAQTAAAAAEIRALEAGTLAQAAGADREAATAATDAAVTQALEARATADRLEADRATVAGEVETLRVAAEQARAEAERRDAEAQVEITAARARILEIQTALETSNAARAVAETAAAEATALAGFARAEVSADLEAVRTALAAERERAEAAIAAQATAEAERQAEAAAQEETRAALAAAEAARVAALAEIETARAAAVLEQQRAAAAAAALASMREQLATLETALESTRGSHEAAATAFQATVTTLERQAAEDRHRAAAEEARAAELNAQVVQRDAEIRTVQQADSEAMAGVIAAHRGLVVDIMRRMVERETDRARRAQVTPEKLRTWLATFYDGHADLMRNALLPAIRVHLAFIRSADDPIETTRRMVDAHVAESVRQIRTVIDEDADAIAASFPALLYRWDTERPTAIADGLMQKELQYARRI